MATASASNVRIEIDTHLDDPDITPIINRVNRDIKREMSNPPAASTDERQDLEAVLAALHIATSRDRAAESVQSGRTSATYEQSLIDELKARAKRLGAPDALVSIGQAKPSAGLSVPDAKGTDD